MKMMIQRARWKPAAVEITVREGRLTVDNFDYQIHFALTGDLSQLAALLQSSAPEPEPVHPARTMITDWAWLTPAYVIRYFEQSADLQAIAADVRKVLAPTAQGGDIGAPDNPQLETDIAKLLPRRAELFDADGQLKYGAKTRVATILGGKPAGSFYYQRVLPAIEAISSTSTAEMSTEEANLAHNAA